MVRFRFKKGLRFLEGVCGWTLAKLTATKKLLFESDDGEASKALTQAEVYDRWGNHRWLVDQESLGIDNDLIYQATPKDLRAVKEDAQPGAKRRLVYITGIQRRLEQSGRRLRCSPKLIEDAAKAVAAELGESAPHWKTIWRWWVKFRWTGCATKLVDGRSVSKRRVDPVQFSIYEEVVSEIFLKQQKHPAKEVVNEIKNRYVRMNADLPEDRKLKPPAPATIYRWLKNLHHALVLRAREGKQISEREMRVALGGVKVKRILDRIEIDHTPVDLLVVDKVTRMVLGRPWLTLAIDRRSRMICGFYLSFHAPSASSVLYCLRMAILPKDKVLEGMSGLVNPWPAHGLPKAVISDNGMDLHANAVETFCLEALIELIYCGVAHPEMKGAIERMFRTLSSDLFHQMPGTVFSSVIDRGDYPSEKLAAIDLDTLTRVLIKWIVDEYHCTPHRGLKGRTPLQVWQEDEAEMSFELPAYPHQLDLMIGHDASRTVFHYGVEYDCLRYNSTLLQSFKHPLKERPNVDIRVYEHDVSFIDVRDPVNDEFVRVPAVDQDYTLGLNRHTHMLVRNLVRERFKDEWTHQQLREAKAEIQAMVAEALKDHKTAKRKAAAAARLHDSEEVLGTRPTPSLDAAEIPADPNAGDEIPIHQIPAVLPQFGSSIRL